MINKTIKFLLIFLLIPIYIFAKDNFYEVLKNDNDLANLGGKILFRSITN